MNRQTTSGPTGFGWVRTLLAFRHRNPVARFVSTLLAFAMATLLVVGSGAAYAGDTPPDPSATVTTDPAPSDPAATDPTTDPATDPAPSTPAASDSTASDPAPADTAPDTSAPSTTTQPRSFSLNTSTKSLAKVNPQASTPPAVPSWIWQGSAPTLDDGEKDNTAYGQGSSEDTNPSTWSQASADTPKADLLKYYFNVDNTSDLIVSFGFTRASTNGDTAFAAEFNQKQNSSNTPPRPVRTPGDVLLKFHVDSGNSTLEFVHAFVWKAVGDFAAHEQQYPQFGGDACEQRYGSGFGWCEIPRTGGAFDTRVTDDGFTAEAQVNLTDLFGGSGCTALFRAVNLRGESSAENWTNSLQDYLPLPNASVPSTCATLVINKYRLGTSTKLAGAHFDVYAGTTATGTPVLSDVYDGKTNVDTDSVTGQITLTGLEPGTYTIKETSGPTGYFAPSGDVCANPDTVGLCSIRTKTVAAKGTATYNFYDLKQWQALTADKSASGSYDVTYDWSIAKGVGSTAAGPFDPDSFRKDIADDGVGDSSASFGYQVTVTQGAQHTSNIAVSGSISVTNPNSEDVTVDLSDTLTGASCSITGGATKTAHPGSNSFGYTCSYADGTLPANLATTNNASVQWSKTAYPQSVDDYNAGGNYSLSPSHAVSWTATKTHDTVTVTDDHHDFTNAGADPAWTITWTAEGTTSTRTYTRSVSAPAGGCASETNTAYVKDGATTLDSDDATATVCVGADLEVTKNRTVSMTRTYLWQIEKSTTDTQITSGDSAHYSVTVDRATGDGYQDSGWAMTGVITVTNPNDWESVTMSSLVDVYGGDNDLTNSCSVVNSRPVGETTWGPVELTLQKNAAGFVNAREYKYSCDFSAKPDYDETNTATATWSAATAHTPSGTASGTAAVTSADWALASTPVNKVITVTDDQYTGGSGAGGHTLGTLDWDNAPHTFTYTLPWTAPAGTCETKDNTATIVETGQDSSAQVLVCNPVGLSVTKTAEGNFTRTYPWTLEKFINGDQTSQTVHIDGFDHTFSYKVKATPGAAVDSGWTVSGTIKVHNDNTDSQIDPITVSDISDLPDVGSTGSCTLDKAVPFDLASGETVDVNYSCTFAQKPTDNSGGELPTYGGTNTASVEWGESGSASSPAVDVDWQDPTEVDKSLPIYDDKTNPPTGELIGTAVWNLAHTPTVVDYTKNLSVDESYAGSCAPAFTNTAWLGGTSEGPSDLNDSTDAIICPNAGTWEVSKVNVDGDGPVPTDSDVTYRLTAHKTGGVNPKNVVLYDDLSAISSYVTLPTQAELDVAAPAGSTAEITGSLITWTIDELGASDQTLEFTVHVNADAYGVDLPNLVTSPGSDNCPDAETAGDECRTDSDTPHYTLQKTSDAGPQVLPPYLGQPGTLITYTLTVHNDSDAPINATTLPGEQVTDDLSAVLDNATWVGNLTPAGQATFDGDHTLTWTLPEIAANGQPGDTVTLTYQVRVAGDQWDQTLTNVAHEGPGGDCLAPLAVALAAAVNPNCTTTTVTPPYALIEALKVDAETETPLPGAEFSLYQGTDPTAENLLDTATSGADGIASFDVKLQPGVFTVVETKAPDGYDLPAGDGASHQVTLTADDLDNGEVPVRTTFGDPPQGGLTLAKAHFERNAAGTGWVASDGTVDFGDEIRYVMTVTATGPKVFHDVALSDYVPGWNPADTTTSPAGTKAVLVPGSITCGGDFTCTTDPVVNGKITWHVTSTGQATGDVRGDVVGTLEFVVRMPDIPGTSPIQTPGTSFAAALWNQATLRWSEFGDETPDTHSLLSNEVVDSASATLPPVVKPPQVSPPGALPNTGGPDRWLLTAGLLLLLSGGAMVAGGQRRRRRV